MSITQGLHRALQQGRGAEISTVCESRTRTHAEVEDRVSRLASALRGMGLSAGDRVSVVSQNSDRMLEVLLGCSWAGIAFSPLNTRWSPAEIAYAVKDVGSHVLVVDDAHSALAAKLRSVCPRLREVLYVGDGPAPEGTTSVESLIEAVAPVPDVHAGGDQLAGIFYTGGTTGHSKGVMLSHGNLVTAALGALAEGDFMVPGGTAMHAAPLFHLAGIWPWVTGMLTAGRHVIVPGFEPQAVIDAVNAHDVTDTLLVPTMIQHVVGRLAQTGERLPSLQHLVYAGSPIPETLMAATEVALPGVRLVQAYGMTELAPVATMLRPEDHVGVHRRSAGRAGPHCLVRIVDHDDHEVANGEVGEITVAGGQVMLGYWNQPEATAQALRGGWMHTGDAGYIDEHGYVYIVDRIKDMIITGGENVYSTEVENALASHPSVSQCAVIGVPDPEWGERVHAVLVLAPGAAAPSLDEVRAHVGERVARFKAPRTIQVLDALPVSAAGKVLKRELRAVDEAAAV